MNYFFTRVGEGKFTTLGRNEESYYYENRTRVSLLIESSQLRSFQISSSQIFRPTLLYQEIFGKFIRGELVKNLMVHFQPEPDFYRDVGENSSFKTSLKK